MLSAKRDNRASFVAKTSNGFTIVELLIVIVVIAILAAISLVAYNGIQQRARVSALSSALSQASKKVAVYHAENSSYPPELATAGVTNDQSITYNYTATSDSYCITAIYDQKMPYSLVKGGAVKEGPCEGQAGGTNYCPNNSHVPVNSYYCEGNEGSVATLNSNAIKLSSSASGVPPGAPGAYVGRQNARDNYASASFSVTPGETYCTEGWVATVNSTVRHGIGLQISGPSLPTLWHYNTAFTLPTTTWKKVSGCMTIPANYTTARMWTQNDGSNGAGADAYWYQTAIKLTKQ